MRFRIRSCGGELVLHSAPGAGTTIEATLPMTT
jgi:signal transduction histidine kinase